MSTVPRRAILLGAVAGSVAACNVDQHGSAQPESHTPILNIVDMYGVSTGSHASQTQAIKDALDANPGKAFFFPPGDYRLDSTLRITKNNSLILAPGARIFAGDMMDTLIDYDNGETTVDGYAQDCCFAGYGKLDGSLKAQTVLRIQSVLRFSLEGLTIVDGIKRGILADSLGGELRGVNLRILNTGTANALDNVGIEAKMRDCQFERVTMRDVTVGVWDRSSNIWTNVHPWLGAGTQLATRFPTSVAFLLTGDSSILINCYADTYRYCFRTDNSPNFSRVRMVAPQVYVNPDNLSDSLATACPGVIFDIRDRSFLDVDNTGSFFGHPAAQYAFTSGSTDRLTFPGSSWGYLSGYAEYRKGVQQGTTSFMPTIYGSATAGSQTYLSRSGTMEIRDGMVSYSFYLSADLGADIAGNLRIGGLPMPPGASSVQDGNGPISVASGVPTAVCLFGENTNDPLAVIPMTIGGSEIDASSVANTAVTIRGSISYSFSYPS